MGQTGGAVLVPARSVQELQWMEYEGLIRPPNNAEVSHGGTNFYKYEVKPTVTSNLKELFPISSN